MIASMSSNHPTLITLLLIPLMSADSVKMNTERSLADGLDPGVPGRPLESPYWEYILREFLFMTISPPPPANNMLYKELLEAPFYKGPFPATGMFNDAGETSQVLSRGEVYHLAKGGWIICQEGCVDCEICRVHKSLTIPTVRWILRGIKRHGTFSPRREGYDRLQLTVVPENDHSFHMKTLARSPYVYVTSNYNGALNSFTDILIRQNKDYHSMRYPFGTKSPEAKNPGEVFTPGNGGSQGGLDHHQATEGPRTENEVLPTESEPRMSPALVPEGKNFPGRKQGREIHQGDEDLGISEADGKRGLRNLRPSQNPTTPLSLLHYPTLTSSTAESIDDPDCPTGKDTKLILGRDQFGEKHPVHVVPAGELDPRIERTSTRFVHQQPEPQPHPLQVDNEGRSLYRKIFRRVIDSLNTHKSAIEKFLLSPKRDSRFGRGESTPTFHTGEKPPSMNNGEDDFPATPGARNIDESKYADETIEDSRSATDDIKAVTEPSGQMFLTPTPPEVQFDEDDDPPTESHDGIVQVMDEDHADQEPHLHLYSFDEQNSDEDLPHGSIGRQNNSESLILKEVAKSVVNHPDDLQGFNSGTNLTSLYRKSHDDSMHTIFKSVNGSAELHFEKKEKNRRHVWSEY